MMTPNYLNHAAIIFFEKAISVLSSPKAYLDPGSGSFILQLVIATLLGGLFIIKGYWTKIKTFIGNSFNRKGKSEEDDITEP